MDASLKQRLVGAVVLVALGVIFLPMLVKGPAPDSGVSDVSLDVPSEPGGDAPMVTRDLPLVAPGVVPEGGATGMPAASPEPAEVDPVQGGLFPAMAGGDYAVSFGSYPTPEDADRVIGALRSAELPAYREAAAVSGRPAHRVRIGPFADRAVAESARLRALHVRDDVGARVIALDAGAAIAAEPSQPIPAPAPVAPRVEPLPAPKPVAAAPAPTAPAAAIPAAGTGSTGFAVQVGAFAAAGEAASLRERLRGAGFNAFTEAVRTDKGMLTRVRVGPAMTRAEADALKAQLKSKLGLDGIVRPHP